MSISFQTRLESFETFPCTDVPDLDCFVVWSRTQKGRIVWPGDFADSQLVPSYHRFYISIILKDARMLIERGFSYRIPNSNGSISTCRSQPKAIFWEFNACKCFYKKNSLEIFIDTNLWTLSKKSLSYGLSNSIRICNLAVQLVSRRVLLELLTFFTSNQTQSQ